jgi:hypothetical protein
MKKLSFFLLLTCLCGMTFGQSPSDFDIQNGTLIAYKGAGGDVVIPNGVITIGNGAFPAVPPLHR